MRPVLLLTAATLSTPPTAPPHRDLTSALEYAINQVADVVVPCVTLAPREPTIPSPPGGAAAALPPRVSDPLTFTPYRVPKDLVVEDTGTMAKGPGASCSLVVPRRADVLAIYDAAASARADAIRASGIRLHLAAEPALDVAHDVVEEVITTMLDVAVAATSGGGRVDLVTRQRDGRASITVSLVASRYSSIREKEPGLGDVRSRAELAARLETCRCKIVRAGGTLAVDSDAEHTTVRVTVPVDAEEEPTPLAVCA